MQKKERRISKMNLITNKQNSKNNVFSKRTLEKTHACQKQQYKMKA
jgi:hypothetical protein